MPSNKVMQYLDAGEHNAMIGHFKAAVKDFDEAIKLKSKDAEAYYNRGLAKNILGDKQGALKDLNKAGKLGLKQAYDEIKKIQGK